MNATMPRRALGAMIFSVFGAAWLLYWCSQKFGLQSFAAPLIVLCAVALFLTSYRLFSRYRWAMEADAHTPERKRISRLFHAVNFGQWLGIVLAVNVLNNMGLADWAVPAAAFIVGLHFLPLGRLLAYPAHYWTGAAMMAAAVVVPLLFGPKDVSVALCAGLILWSAAWRAISTVRGAARQLQPQG